MNENTRIDDTRPYWRLHGSCRSRIFQQLSSPRVEDAASPTKEDQLISKQLCVVTHADGNKSFLPQWQINGRVTRRTGQPPVLWQGVLTSCQFRWFHSFSSSIGFVWLVLHVIKKIQRVWKSTKTIALQKTHKSFGFMMNYTYVKSCHFVTIHIITKEIWRQNFVKSEL